MSTERWFPIQERRVPRIPWADAEIAYKCYRALYGDQQSLERLAQRAGFGLIEYQAYRRVAEMPPMSTSMMRDCVDAEVKSLYDEAYTRYGSTENYKRRDMSPSLKGTPPPGPYVAEYFVPLRS